MVNSWVVIKFGGTSVSDRVCWENIAAVIEAHRAENLGVMLVCSAMQGASDSLSQLGFLALENDHALACAELEARYVALAETLNVSVEPLRDIFSELHKRLDGVSFLGELTARTRAEIMAAGERALTALGVEFLRSQSLQATELDATELLQAKECDATTDSAYLSAVCDVMPDSDLQKRCSKLPEPLAITQGFLAANQAGETVLLGRGGSDVSAAYLATKLEAVACEIWTDVAGVYSANPHVVSKARVILSLGYDEAQEIAAMGGKVLHPNCLAPLKSARIPLKIKKTKAPHETGTCVSWGDATNQPAIKSISVKKDVVLISIEAVSMWRSAGFLADTFACFKRHSLSVDLVSTAESCVTVSLDRASNLLDARALENLLADLNGFASANTIGPCAAISLVGSGIRAILSDLSEVLTQFQSHRIYLLSQAANDLNLTFVVDEEKADRLCQQIHHILIENQPPGDVFSSDHEAEDTSVMAWWSEALAKRDTLCDEQMPGYFYSETVIAQQIDSLKAMSALNALFYAIKANPCPAVLSAMHRRGVQMECVSRGEIEHVFACLPDLTPQEVLFTPNFAAKNEYKFALEKGVWVTLDSAYPLQMWPELFANQEVLLRMDPGQGRGHHKHVMTAGQSAKFGIPLDQLPDVMASAHAAGARVVGLHAHAGSGVLDPTHWTQIAYFLAECLEHCPDVRVLNCGGGLGIAESPWQEPLDLSAVNDGLVSFKQEYPHIDLWLEPGRFLVAQSGVLLVRVTQLKEKGEKLYVGVETGMNSLLRPALYGAYHPMINLTRFGEPMLQEATVVGPICESADVLGYDRLLPKTEEGDIIAIGLVGAYGESMSSHYNMREPAQSMLWEANQVG